MATAEECFREAEKLEQEVGREEEAREMYLRAAKMRAAAEEESGDKVEEPAMELPPGLDISRVRLSDAASDTSRDYSQPPGLGRNGRANRSSESTRDTSAETDRDVGESNQTQTASMADVTDLKGKGADRPTAPCLESGEKKGNAKVEEEEGEEEEEEDWETALDADFDKKIPEVPLDTRSNRSIANSSSVKGRGNFRYGISSHMDEEAYAGESNAEGVEADDFRERNGVYYDRKSDLDPNRVDPDEELYKSQTPIRPRPKTTTVVANRLIASALNHGGLRQHIKRTDREAGRALEKSRQAKREERSRAQALRDSAWDD